MEREFVPTTTLTVRIPLDVADKLNKLVKDSGGTKTAFVVNLIREAYRDLSGKQRV